MKFSVMVVVEFFCHDHGIRVLGYEHDEEIMGNYKMRMCWCLVNELLIYVYD